MDYQITFRLAGARDFSGIDALLCRSYPILLRPYYDASILASVLPIITRARPELVASGTYWVALMAGQIVGAGGWSFDAPGDGEIVAALGHVRHVVTDDRMVRRGIASGLMRRAMDQASTAGATQLDCLSTRTAVPFYTALGFTAQEEVLVPLAGGILFPAVRMACSLR